MTGVRGGVEDGVEVDAAGDLAVGSDELAEILLLVPGAERMPLNEPVRLVAFQPGCDEREQEPLAEEEAVARLEVPPHPLGADDEALDEPGEAVQHVVEREEGIGDDDALGRRVGDVPLVPERYVLEADRRPGADDAGEAADALGDDRVALVRHRGRALLALAERLHHLGDLGPREVAYLERELLERGGGDRKRGQEFCVAVSLEDLRRGGSRVEPQPFAGDSLDLRVGRGVGPDGAGELADPHPLQRVLKAVAVAVELERPDGELEAEGRRLRVHAVRAADLERLAVLLRQRHDRREGALDPGEDQRAGVADLERQGGVDDVRGRQAVVEPAPIRAERLAHRVDERRRIVMRARLDLRDAVGRRRLRARPNLGDRVGGDTAGLGPAFERGQLDI